MEQFLGLPPDGAAHGPAIDYLIGLVHWLMLVLFVGWGAFYVFVLIRFRKSRQPKANYAGVKNHASSYLEVAVLVIEVILLIGFSIPLWSKRVDAFPAQKDATVVRIVGEQFAWNVHYPGADGKFGKSSPTLIDADNPLGLDRTDPDAKDDIVAANNLNLPVNKPVIVYLSTKDVIHSFNLPTYRVKQDAIPGMSIPLWFTPVKTTDAIREEMRKKYSVSDLMKRVQMMVLPQMSMITVKRGMNMEDRMLMKDVTDASGGMVIAKGEHLDTTNIAKLVDAGVGEVSARPMADLEKYVAMQEVKDDSGATVVAKGEALTEETVTKLLTSGKKEVSVRPVANMDTFVAMDPITDKAGNTLAVKGDALSEELLNKLAEAGINEIVIAPATPTEIACAQLCGLGHFRMRGYVTVQSPEDFKQWFDQQEASLQPQTTPTDSTTPAVSDTLAH